MGVHRVKRSRVASASRGLTLVEMLVTLALVGVAASIVLPLASLMETRAKESELRQSLRTIRQALDAYKAAVDGGVIDRTTGASGYPPNLLVLEQGAPKASGWAAGSPPVIFLRKVPRDPFFEDKTVPAASTWNVRSYDSGRAEGPANSDVFDISSKSERSALDGTRYADW